MGYYTNYTLGGVFNGDGVTNYKKEINDAYYAFNGECKWYKHDDDMCAYSLKYPQTVFMLKGEGEEAMDLWYKYYHNGKMIKECRAQIVYEDFNAHQWLRDNKINEIISND